MGGPVRVNGREVVTAKSGGVSLAMGDVCLLPGGGGPVPFVNMAVSSDAANGARTVRVHGVPVVLARSTFARSAGDEAGEDGGLISHTTQGPAMFVNYSFDVHIEGQPVPRAFDPMIHNLDAGGVPNAFSPAELQAVGVVDPEKDILCAAMCYCAAAGERMDCFQRLLATPVQSWFPAQIYDPSTRRPKGKVPVRCWDPHLPPGFYIEPSYKMEPPPPQPMLGDVKSATMKDAQGEPLPLPAGDRPYLPGSRRPDVVVPIDPTKPPGPGNVKRIFDVKFPGDREKPHQRSDYGAIGAPVCKTEFLYLKDCDCAGRHKPKKKYLPKEIDMPRLNDGPQAEPKNQDQPRNQEPEPNEEPDPNEEPEPPPEPLPGPTPREDPEPQEQPAPTPEEPPADLPLAAKVGMVIVMAAVGASVAGPAGAAAGAAAGVVLIIAGSKKDDGPRA